ncbi:MAG: hypothetical protein IAG10_34365 [Planctomycetaceae bacterium]|nr:hypothetical protein [Planctomycetaceae bacterium]
MLPTMKIENPAPARPHWLRLLALPMILLASFAFAADEDDDDPPAAAVPVNRGFFVQEENFDQWVFQGSVNAAAGKTRIQSSVTMKLAELRRVCDLTDAQSKKLSLAARGDMRQFFEDVEIVRQKFLKVRNDQNAFNQIWQEINPLQQRQAAGLFGDSSFFAKTVRNTLTREQHEKYQVVLDDRRRFRYQAAAELALHNISNTVALRHDQHEAIFKLIIEETQPPLTFGQYDQYFVFYSLAKLPNAKLKPLLDDRQWKLLQPYLQQGRGMESTLMQRGMIEPPKGRLLKSVRTFLPEADDHSEAPAAAKTDAAQ